MGKIDSEVKKRGRGRPKKSDGNALPPPPPVIHRAVGIDIGVDGVHVCFPNDDLSVNQWPVYFVDYKNNYWREQLLSLLDEKTVVTAEPTGWHYLMPVARVITQESPAALWLVDHSATGSWRETADMQQKTDINDARALAGIADKIYFTRKAAGARLLDWSEQEELLELRFMMNTFHKLKKEAVRHRNRLKHLGHSIDPRLTHGKAWFKFMENGAYTPNEILAFNPRGIGLQPSTVTAMVKLKAALRPVAVSPMLYSSLVENFTEYQRLTQMRVAIMRDLIQRVKRSRWAWLYRVWITAPNASPAAVIALIIASKGRPQELEFKVFRATVGMYPVLKYSGTKKQAKSARRGYRPAMALFHMWVQSLLKKNAVDNIAKRYFAGGVKKGGRKFSATKARWLRVLHGMAKSRTPYNPFMGKEPPRTVAHGHNPQQLADSRYHEYMRAIKSAADKGDVLEVSRIMADIQSAGLIKPPDPNGSDHDNPPPPNGKQPKRPNGSRRPMSNGKLIDAPLGLDSVPLDEDAPPPKRGRPPKR